MGEILISLLQSGEQAWTGVKCLTHSGSVNKRWSCDLNVGVSNATAHADCSLGRLLCVSVCYLDMYVENGEERRSGVCWPVHLALRPSTGCYHWLGEGGGGIVSSSTLAMIPAIPGWKRDQQFGRPGYFKVSKIGNLA